MANRLKILLSNDDGIAAPGLKALAAGLSPVANIFIVAPDGERSAIGTAVTLRRPLKVQPVTVNIDGVKAWATDGTPGDSVILGLEKLCPNVDIVISGINSGHNLGDDVLISGTIGGGLQGFLRHKPTIAVSVADETYFPDAALVAAALAVRISRGTIPPDVFLNVNYPSLPLTEVASVAITRLSRESHLDSANETPHGNGTYYHLVRERIEDNAAPGTDIYAIEHNCVSVSALHTSMLRRPGPELAKAQFSGLLEELKASAVNNR
jgi:5'/3'-nucleotidase